MEVGNCNIALRIEELRRAGQLTVEGLATILVADHHPRTACELMQAALEVGLSPILQVSERRHVSTWTHGARTRITGPTTAYYQGGGE